MRKSVCVIPALAAMVLAAPTQAADLPIYEVVADDAVIGEIISSWDGFFVGVNAGYASQKNRGNFVGGLRPSFEANGFIGGIHAGYNYQIGYLVLGVEADYSYLDVNETVAAPLGNFDTETNWLSTVRARAGVASNGYLFYLTGGAAFTNIKTTYQGVGISNSDMGWTAGAGLEMAVGNNISIRGEYLYVNLGEHNATYGATTAGYSTDMHIARAGLNYHFR